MKVILTAILMLNFHQTVSAEVANSSFRFSEKDCSALSKDIADTIFEQKKSKLNKEGNKYEQEKWEYINKSQADFSANMKKLCSSKKDNVSIADFSNAQATCTIACKDNIKMVRGAFFKVIEDVNKTIAKAQEICESACEEGQQKFEAIKSGIAYGLKNKSSPDCSGVVAGEGRGVVKPSFNGIDSINEKAKKIIAK